MFVDQASIRIRAGKGGDGAVSFRREKYVPKGGPDGGNGGDGGSVVLLADSGLNTLVDFRGLVEWYAQDGDDGGASQCSGKAGKDCITRLPPGTMVYNEQTGELIHDLKPDEQVVIAKGGRGGFGNEHFKRATNQTPRKSEAGEPGQAFRLRLELKLIAEVGITGMPNAGKSTDAIVMFGLVGMTTHYLLGDIPYLRLCHLDPELSASRARTPHERRLPPGVRRGGRQGARGV